MFKSNQQTKIQYLGRFTISDFSILKRTVVAPGNAPGECEAQLLYRQNLLFKGIRHLLRAKRCGQGIDLSVSHLAEFYGATYLTQEGALVTPIPKGLATRVIIPLTTPDFCTKCERKG